MVPLCLFEEAIGPGRASLRSQATLQSSTSGRPAPAPITPDHLPYRTSQPRLPAQGNMPPRYRLRTAMLKLGRSRLSASAARPGEIAKRSPPLAVGSSRVQPSVTPSTGSGAHTYWPLHRMVSGLQPGACALLTQVPQLPSERACLSLIRSIAGADGPVSTQVQDWQQLSSLWKSSHHTTPRTDVFYTWAALYVNLTIARRPKPPRDHSTLYFCSSISVYLSVTLTCWELALLSILSHHIILCHGHTTSYTTSVPLLTYSMSSIINWFAIFM